MKTILDTIVEHKRMEVLKRKRKYAISDYASFPHYRRKANPVRSTEAAGDPGIIAEFKRKSPSKGPLNMEVDPVEVARGYDEAGVAAMSILTDRNFFGGSFRDLLNVRGACPELPLLRKDFIIDPYQVHEASAYGADIILLIAAVLDTEEVSGLAAEASSLGLEVLLEVHSADELVSHQPSIRYVGVNNRDLRTFRVDTGRSMELIGQMPEGVVAVSESGISDPSEVRRLHENGFQLFLMGETFMKTADPGKACRSFIENL